jgi:hypothetical protein
MFNPVTAHVMSLPVCTLIMVSCLYFNTIVISLPFTGNDRCTRLMVMFEGMLKLKMEITQLELPMKITLKSSETFRTLSWVRRFIIM